MVHAHCSDLRGDVGSVHPFSSGSGNTECSEDKKVLGTSVLGVVVGSKKTTQAVHVCVALVPLHPFRRKGVLGSNVLGVAVGLCRPP